MDAAYGKRAQPENMELFPEFLHIAILGSLFLK
jgi:hypothetical protein